MFRLVELVLWLGVSEFEIFVHLVGTLLFTVLLAMRIEHMPAGFSGTALLGVNASLTPTWFGHPLDWFTVFAPLFGADILNGYFVFIVGIRMYVAQENKRKALHRLLWSAKFLVLISVFKYLLCLKLQGTQNLEYSEVFAPVFVLLQLVAVRACKMTGN